MGGIKSLYEEMVHQQCLIFRDAEDAVHARDGYDYDGYRLRVEFPRGGGPSNNFRGGRGAGDSGRGGRGEMSNSRGRGPPARRSQYRVLVTGLPPSGSWQDLKDHMREAGDVCFADVYKDGTGVVEFLRHDDMKYAVKKLDDSRFRSHEVRLCAAMRIFTIVFVIIIIFITSATSVKKIGYRLGLQINLYIHSPIHSIAIYITYDCFCIEA